MTIVLFVAVGAIFAMRGWPSALAVFLSYLLGVFGWAQIIGSLQNIRVRSAAATVTTILIWIVILGGITFAVYSIIPSVMLGYLVGLAISLVHILISGRIK